VVKALDGVETVVHCASDPRHPQAVDVNGTQHLVDAVAEAGHVHLMYVSIVGVDEIPLRFYRAKRTAEEMVERVEGGWTIQRVTQFHPFVAAMLERYAKRPMMVVPRQFRFQPIDPGEVADRLVVHVARGATGRAVDLGGPDVVDLTDLARTWLEATGRSRPLLALPVPGRLGAAFRRGANLCPDGVRGVTTWQQYLDREVARRSG
jgi:uncharacterized protein YbjT (DUF2867 family)